MQCAKQSSQYIAAFSETFVNCKAGQRMPEHAKPHMREEHHSGSACLSAYERIKSVSLS